MRLRFQILSPTNTGTPDYIICGQVSSNVVLTGTGLEVGIDSTPIISTTNLGTYTFPVGTITTTNGYVISNIQRVNTYFIEMDIAMTMAQVVDMSITATRAGYLSYNNVFKLFGYDLGNNPNALNGQAQPITYNPNMDIYLIAEANNVVNGIQTKAFSAFTEYRKPFTDDIYIYSLSSTQGKIKYIDNTNATILSVGNGYFTRKATVDIQQNVELWDYVNNVYTLISSCNSAFIHEPSKTFIPSYEVTHKCKDMCGVNSCSVSTESTNIASVFIDYANVSTFYINDTLSYSYADQIIEYNLIDFTGNVIQEQDYSFTFTDPTTYVYDFSLYNFDNFRIPEKGDFILQVKIGSAGIYECIKNIKVSSCNWFEIEQTNCNEYTAVNNSFEDLTLTVSKLVNKVFVVQDTKPFTKLGTVSNVLIVDGVYKLSTTRNGVESSFIIINYCNIKNCLHKYINNILCPEDCGCAENKAVTDFNSTVVLAMTFFNMINEEYNYNFLYTTLDADKLNSLFNIDLVITKLSENCADNDCDC